VRPFGRTLSYTLMATKREIERLREEVLSRHAAASAKISRNRAKGIEIAGTQFDLRRDIAKVRRYNMQQLNNYLNDLIGFTSRSTQFVAGAKSQPIPRERFNRLKELENRVNMKVDYHENRIANIMIPSSGMTIAERKERFGSKKRGQGSVVDSPFQKFDREAFRINGAKAVEQLIKDMQNRLRPGYLNTKNAKNSRGLIAMMKALGDVQAIEMFHALTPNQKDILMNHTKFATSLAQKYGFKQMDVDDQYGNVVEDGMEDVRGMLDWASKQPKK